MGENKFVLRTDLPLTLALLALYALMVILSMGVYNYPD